MQKILYYYNSIFLYNMVNKTDIPFTYENSSNPWLMDKKDNSSVIEIDGNKITASYLWSLDIDHRQDLLNKIFEYYRDRGFPYIEMTDKQIEKEFYKIQKYDSNNVLTKNGYISNSGSLGIDLVKYFSKDYFYKAKGGPSSLSVEDVFYDDELFIKVLKNRMGWNSTKEDGVERPYMFPISDKQILNGIRNSGLGYGVSNFRVGIAKWMYETAIEMLPYNQVVYSIFDYSGGWGARALAALSLDCNYTCTDPLTYNCIYKLCEKIYPYININIDYAIYDRCSEDEFFLDEQFKEKYDVIGSCPPYFDLEIYSDDQTQSITDKSYEEWLNLYWKGTIKNCYHMLQKEGIFILVIKENHGKYELKKDMHEIIYKQGFRLIKTYQYKSNTNHLSSKSKTGRSTKTNEYILFYQK